MNKMRKIIAALLSAFIIQSAAAKHEDKKINISADKVVQYLENKVLEEEKAAFRRNKKSPLWKCPKNKKIEEWSNEYSGVISDIAIKIRGIKENNRQFRFSKVTYEEALLNYEFFNEQKAREKLWALVKLGIISKKKDMNMFISLCRYFPLKKFYAGYRGFDPTIKTLNAIAETRVDESPGIFAERGSEHVLPSTAKIIKEWCKNDTYYNINMPWFWEPNANLISAVHLDNILNNLKNHNFWSMSSSQIIKMYETWVGGTKGVKDTTRRYWVLANLRAALGYLWLLPYVENAVRDGGLISESKIKNGGLAKLAERVPSEHGRYLLKCMIKDEEPNTKGFPYLKKDDYAWYVDYSEGGCYSKEKARKIAFMKFNDMKKAFGEEPSYDNSFALPYKPIIIEVQGNKVYVKKIDLETETASKIGILDLESMISERLRKIPSLFSNPISFAKEEKIRYKNGLK